MAFIDDPAEWQGWGPEARPPKKPAGAGVPVVYDPRVRIKPAPIKNPSLPAQIITFIGLFLFSEFLFSLVLAGPVNPQEYIAETEGPSVRGLYYLFYVAIAACMMMQMRRMWRSVRAAPRFVALVALVVLSSMWSLDPGVTFRRSFAFAVSTAFGLYIGANYSWMALIRLLALLYVAMITLSLALILAAPDLGRDFVVHGGAWRGGWQEKNAMGAYMARGLAVFIAAAMIDYPRRWLWAFFGLVCVFMAVMSKSATSLIACSVCIAAFLAVAIFKRGTGLVVVAAWLGLFSAMTLGIAMALRPDLFVSLIGKDLTFTGRTDIWEVVTFQLTQYKAWTWGFGYGSFWVTDEGPAYWIRVHLQWPVPNAHNGWLETILGIGLVGVTLIAFQMVITFFMALLQVRRAGPGVSFAIAFLMLFLLYSLSESYLMQQNNIIWVLFVAITVKMMKPVIDARVPKKNNQNRVMLVSRRKQQPGRPRGPQMRPGRGAGAQWFREQCDERTWPPERR